ncbi:SusC/RagA family TonB-linked outer membrane protein [Parapedobacter koreensis]|uniref:TonB-linked outer membrane protein, SusC/RagA family n=1 Tax=Parapedobacter koreensis TaxID=332977 RepID=A0A1H7RSZ3_9SPHI|nr:TonB-dependent receptor [Parapedobacter koreensis]SEL63323.1 TonB-linked outer membrane protein, SusC/RagA family [Parapedobacter koreensis]
MRTKYYKTLVFRALSLLCFVVGGNAAMAQIRATGIVTDSVTTAPISGVTVTLQGTSASVQTDGEGRFTIEAPLGGTLVFSSVGYVRKSATVVDGSLPIQLSPTAEVLDEVYVVSYGTQKKRELTGAVAQVDATRLRDIPVPNIGQKLQGRMAGVQINHNSGTPGSEMSFRIRGAASIGAGNQPLIVIDGFPSASGLQTLSPDEIESISVLKDASAAALYGSRAANGVVLVTTKQAKDGQQHLEISANIGTQQVPQRGRPDLMNAQEFAQFKKEYYEDAARYEGYTGGVPEAYADPSRYAGNYGTDWFDVLLRDAMNQNYNVSYSSGTTKLKSVFNLNFNKQDGVMLNTSDRRITVRTNNVYNASERLTLGLNVEFSNGYNNGVAGLDNGRNIIQLAYLMDPALSYRNEDGTYPISFSQPGMFANPNWYLVVTERIRKARANRFLANGYVEFELLEGLKAKTSFNVNTNNMTLRAFNPSNAQGGLGSAPPQMATGRYETSGFVTWMSENTLTYQRSFNDSHNIDLLSGYTVQKYATENSFIDGREFADDDIPWISAAITRIGNVGAADWSLLSYYGRVNYNYQGKYLASFAFRSDGSSKFGQNTRFGDFPSASLGWVVSEESFMQNVRPIDLLKLRVSYGKVGNNNIGDYTYLASVNSNDYVFNGQVTPGKSLNGIGNSFLTWETTEGYDIGLDMELFNHRLSFTYDYYWKKTDGLLYGIDIPIQSGFSSVTSNVGRFDFWGHEFTVGSRNLVGNFQWTTDFNISFDRNLVKKLGTNDAPIGGYNLYWDDNRTAVGHPIGLFYGYINTGVYMTQEEFETQPHGATSMVGTARFADISGPDGVPDGVIDQNDRTFIGNPNPTFAYGLTNTFSYKNFDLSIVLAGTVGNDIADDAFQSTENLDGVFNVRKGVAGRWRSEENPGDGIYPRTRSGTTEDFRNFTTRQVFDGSYIAAKNITLGYTFTSPTITYFKSIRAYLSAQNAFMLTNYPGLNPEAGISGLNGLNQGRDFTGYPIPRIFSAGIHLGF